MGRPNIVLILADDMGYGDFGIFNRDLSCTPTLDRLAGEGLTLRQHYSASPVCAPARAGLMTGRYPHRTGAIDTLEGRGLDRLGLREMTMADLFGSAGYRTGLVGKWHLGALDPRYHPNARGFEEFVGFRGGWHDYERWWLHHNDSIRKSDGRYLTDVFSEEAVQFIRRHRREPFFLHVTYNAPHWPYQAPNDVVKKYRDKGLPDGVSFIYGMIEVMDRGIGRILAELTKQGIEENTIVLFTSDNGPDFSNWGGFHTVRQNSDWRGSKCFTYEGGIRVPMVVRWPAGLPARPEPSARSEFPRGNSRQGVSERLPARPEPSARDESPRGNSRRRETSASFIEDMVHFVDWLPTLAAAAEVKRPDGPPLDGVNVLPVLRGESGDVETRRAWQWNRYEPVITSNAAIRDGSWKLVRPQIPETFVMSKHDIEQDRALKYEPERFHEIVPPPYPKRTIPPPPPAELYDLHSDPLEQHDLADQEPGRVELMIRQLEAWFDDVERDRRSVESI